MVSESLLQLRTTLIHSQKSSANIFNQLRLMPFHVIGSHLDRLAAAGDNLTGLAQSLGPVFRCRDCER